MGKQEPKNSTPTPHSPCSRIMDSTEVQETWDAETTSSWSQITQDNEYYDDDDDDDCCSPTPQTPQASVVEQQRTAPPPQIAIPTVVADSIVVEQRAEGGDSSTSSSGEEDPSFSSSGETSSSAQEQEEQVSESASELSETPQPMALMADEPHHRHHQQQRQVDLLASPVPVAPKASSMARRLFPSFSSRAVPPLPPLKKPHKRTKSRDHNKRPSKQKSFLDSVPARYFVYAVGLWIFELLLVMTLKRAGVMEVSEFMSLPTSMTNVSSINNLPALVLQSLKLWGNDTANSLQYLTQEQKRPGFQLRHQGAVAKYPLVLIPGFVTSGLEVWGGKECARKHFRQRMWAALVGARSFFTDRDCWRQHMMLDPLTGGDPEGIRLRAASGFEAVDYFMANYWVFGKIIENLADVGYTPSEMTVEPYDWRLAFPMLEQRDGYFTRVKNKIEAMHKTNGKKVVITSHSMGVLVVHYFFAWVTCPNNGGHANWVDQHVHAYVNIAGSHLGVPKAITSLLSGEMSDTVVMNPMAQAVESFFGRKLRRELWGTWGSIWAMIPKGGNALWSIGADMCPRTHNLNNPTTAPSNATSDNEEEYNNDSDTHAETDDMSEPQCSSDEQENVDASTTSKDPFCPGRITGGKDILAPFLRVTDDDDVLDDVVGPHIPNIMTRRRMIMHKHDKLLDHNTTSLEKNAAGVSPLLKHFLAQREFSLKSVIDFVKQHGLGNQLANARMYSLYGSPSKPTANRKQEPAWHDPTQTPLPHAPKMKIYCLYGVGKPTERAYYYKLNRPEQDNNGNTTAGVQVLDPPLILDSEVSDPDNNIITGVKYADGDGSVPLLSLGYLCADAWTRPNSGLNPSRSDVYTREYRHKAEFTVDDPMRSGPKSGDHVDVLGNVDMTEDLLRILTGFEVEEKVNQNHIVSDIQQIAHDIHAQGGGIFQRGNNKNH